MSNNQLEPVEFNNCRIHCAFTNVVGLHVVSERGSSLFAHVKGANLPQQKEMY